MPPLAIAFTLCLSRKTLFRDSLGKLAIAFPPCLSRKRRFQGVARRPKSAPFRMILGTSSGSSRSPFEDNSVIDVAALITGKDANNAARDVAFVKDRHPEVNQKLNE